MSNSIHISGNGIFEYRTNTTTPTTDQVGCITTVQTFPSSTTLLPPNNSLSSYPYIPYNYTNSVVPAGTYIIFYAVSANVSHLEAYLYVRNAYATTGSPVNEVYNTTDYMYCQGSFPFVLLGNDTITLYLRNLDNTTTTLAPYGASLTFLRIA